MTREKDLTRRRFVALGTGAAAAFASSALPAVAQENWPQRQVIVVVPFTAGGTTDMFGRIFAQAMQAKYGQPFIVENKAGAGGTVGAGAVAQAAKDGYTLLVGTASTHAIAPFVYKRLSYNPETDFQPISLFATLPNLLVVSPKMPVKTFPEFIEYLKQNSGKLSYGSSGVGASNHLPAEMIANITGTKMAHVPYRSSGDIMNAIAGGHIDLAFDNMTLAWPQAEAGTVRAIAVTSKDRSPTAPDIPAIAETIPGLDVSTWHGLFAPAGVPRPIIDRIAADVKAIYSTPDVQAKLKAVGAVASPNTPDEFTMFSAAERNKYRDIVRSAGIEPQ
ncbi:Bug family tripartite tricarboxylate transporter substrate binding protein [Enterovirga aerilata]|uniref:Tripartite tricarboxylate transporter substrate binding protein n=1 Tax=Enterovirga aerilata TaxID=2730920 RepID=A0A849I812_9HYPH|nr:tripartite tricarboxylate transporter substrate-binding protein [Enterovirga sp. DB1703]NNM72200.1 tripartite tricarboxylate transporter substrate binding protein [Enterovirga sp. DB1703]